MTAAPIVTGLALRDDDAAPLALGVAMARLTGAPLALVSAYAPVPPASPSMLGAAERENAVASLEGCAADLRADHEVSVYARRGSPARVLHESSEELEAALLVVGSSHRGGAGRVFAGSVAARLLSGATCAVAVAPRGYAGTSRFDRIAVAYDGSPESREALGAAMALAYFGGGGIHSYTLVEPFTWPSFIAGAGTSVPLDYEPLRRAHAEEVAEEVLALAPEGLAVQSYVLEGHASDVLASLSRDFDLLVCGSRGYGPVRSVLIGGVSHALVNHAGCPVLVLPRPPARKHWLSRHPAVAGELRR
jgi:nucleotide-binding universal stress UspA family protein